MEKPTIDRIVAMLEDATSDGRITWKRASEKLVYSDDLSSGETPMRVGVLFRVFDPLGVRALQVSQSFYAENDAVSGHYVLTFDALDGEHNPSDNLIRIDTRLHKDYHERIAALFKQAQLSIDVPPENAEFVLSLIDKLAYRKGS